MKKTIQFVAAAVFALMAFSSCSKDYKCACDNSIGEGSMATTYQVTAPSKSKAKAACEGMDQSDSVGEISVSKSCHLE